MEVKIEPTSKKSPGEVDRKENPWWIVRTIFTVILVLVKMTGLVPFTLSLETKTVNFKLLSWRTFFAFFRLIVFTFPFIILPIIFYAFGFVEDEAFKAVLAASYGHSFLPGTS